MVELLAEGKRQGKILSILSAQRDAKAREATRIETKEKDTKKQVQMKELTILDLTKRSNELSNRLKEFTALYEVVKNERNKYVNLIQSSSQALAEMREKIRILHNEVSWTSGLLLSCAGDGPVPWPSAVMLILDVFCTEVSFHVLLCHVLVHAHAHYVIMHVLLSVVSRLMLLTIMFAPTYNILAMSRY